MIYQFFILTYLVDLLNFFSFFRNALKDAMTSPEAMSLDEAYANAVITEALDTEDEDEAQTKSDLNATGEDKKDI